MGNFGKIDFLESIENQEYSLDYMLDEITDFNNNYGFIEYDKKNTKQKVNTIISQDELFETDRCVKSEQILRFAKSLEKIGLKITDYRWEEFYQNNIVVASWNKIGIDISDKKLFKEFISTQSEETSEKLYTFLFQVILDSARLNDFYWESKARDVKNMQLVDQLEYLDELWNITSIHMNNLIQDYKNRSLYQSLLSKFIITNYTPQLMVVSLKNITDFSLLTNAWNESFKVLKLIMDSESYKSHHEQHLRLLANTLKNCLDDTYTLIFSDLIRAKEDYDSGNKENLYKNNGHKIFVQEFYKKLHSRKYLIEQILWEKKDEN